MNVQKIKAWTRLIVTILIIVLAVLIIVMNRDNTASLWFFRTFSNIPVLWLIFITALATLVGYWIIRGVHHAYRDVKKTDHPEGH